jgi:hypothetical protein
VLRGIRVRGRERIACRVAVRRCARLDLEGVGVQDRSESTRVGLDSVHSKQQLVALRPTVVLSSRAAPELYVHALDAALRVQVLGYPQHLSCFARLFLVHRDVRLGCHVHVRVLLNLKHVRNERQ